MILVILCICLLSLALYLLLFNRKKNHSFYLDETARKILEYEIQKDILKDDLERRLSWFMKEKKCIDEDGVPRDPLWIIRHKIERSFEHMCEDWDPVIAKKGIPIPKNMKKHAELIFSMPGYKDRATRTKELEERDSTSPDDDGTKN